MAPRIALAALAIATFALGDPAASATIKARFDGRVVGPSLILAPELVGLVSVGSPVSGTFRYDSEAEDSHPASTRGDYRQPAGFGITASVGGASISTDFSSTGFFVQVLAGHPLGSSGGRPVDRFGVISNANTPIAPASVDPRQLQLFFGSSDPQGIGSAELSEFVRAMRLGTLANGSGQIATVGGQSPQVFMNFEVSSVELVPEPGATSLLVGAMGLAAFGARRRLPSATTR